MTNRPIRCYSGKGELIFGDGEAVAVFYDIQEPINADGTRDEREPIKGRVSHAEGHPNWHPITLLNPGPFTLVTENGPKIKVTVVNMEGAIRAAGNFF